MIQQPIWASETERVLGILNAAGLRAKRYQHDGGIAIILALPVYQTLTISVLWDEVDDIARIVRASLIGVGYDDKAVLSDLFSPA